MLKKEIYNFYFPILKKYKILFILMALNGIISGLLSVWMPVLLKMETDQLVSKQGLNIFWNSLSGFEVFMLILAIILITNIIERVIQWITDIFISAKKDLLANDIQCHLFKKMENMEIGRSMNSRYKYITKIIDTEFPAISSKIMHVPKEMLEFIIQLIWMTAIYAYFDIKLLWIVVISSIIWYFIELVARKTKKKYEVEWKFTLWRQIYKYSSLFLYDFTNLAISGWVSSTIKKYEYLLNKENKNFIKRDLSGLIWDIEGLMNYNIRDILLKWIVWYGVFIGTNSVGMVVFVISSMGTIWGIISQIFSVRNQYRDFLFQQESILLMLKIYAPIWSINYDKKVHTIEFKNISFAYKNLAIYEQEYFEILQKYIIGKGWWKNWLDENINALIETMKEESKIPMPHILSGTSFQFERWKVYGIVGKNGAGKTSLMYLLAWFFRWYDGEILFNGENTKDFTTTSFLEKISFLTQIPFNIEREATVRDNLFLWVWDDKTDEKAWEYLELFWLAHKIKKTKKWLDSEIGNNLSFSGWEYQILSFIRILLQDKDIVILDEWTNQLDAENEILVMNELLKHKQNKIIIFITHRMSTISRADEIYCLEDGKFSSKWTHIELMKENTNMYAKFYRAQVLHIN